MPRRRHRGKRIRMEDPVPPENEAAVSNSDENSDGARANSSLDSQSSHEDPTVEVQVPFRSMRVTRNTQAQLSGASTSQPKYKEADEDFVPPAPVTSKPRGGGKGRTKRTPKAHNLEDVMSLYNAVYNSLAPLDEIVDKWIEKYTMNKESALFMVMQFFISASGCKGTITPEMHTLEHVDIIRIMTEIFNEDTGEYPIVKYNQRSKKFRSDICEFVQILVRKCQYSILYDQFLMDNVISLLTGLSDSQVRAFRHTTTLAAMKLMTALVDVELILSVNLNNVGRQYDAENQKSIEEKATDRLENLLSKKKELEENMVEIKNMLSYMIKAIFVHRYRDVLPEIRVICMTEFGIWMKKCHQNYLDDCYLKYLGWTLFDKVSEVRLGCLQALQPMYASKELNPKLELFTSKFKDRLVAMILDKEPDVAVEAIKLMTSIYKYQRDIFSNEQYERIYELVFCSHRGVAQAAGEFVSKQIFTSTEKTQEKTRCGKIRSPNTHFIKDLILFFIESELHEHAAYLVDSLIEINPMMKDWECMTDLLLEEPGPNEEALDNQQETALIEIMFWCVKQSATGENPIGRGVARKVLSAKENKQIKEDKKCLTEHFIKVLPLLIGKYGADPEKLINLVAIPQYFQLDIYTKSRQEQNLELLLNRIQDLVEKSTNEEVLDDVAKTLEYMCVPGSAIFTKCDITRSKIHDAIALKYYNSINEFRYTLDENEQPDEDQIYAVVESLKKLEIFYGHHDINQHDIWESLYKNMKETRYELPDEAIKCCIGSCFFSILWAHNYLIKFGDSDRQAEEKCQTLKSRLHEFLECMYTFLNSKDISFFIRKEAFKIICDVLIIFCNQLRTHSNPLIHELIYEADENKIEMLIEFIQQYIFHNCEESDQMEISKIADVHEKRTNLAGFCKLIVYNIVPMKGAAHVLKHFIKYYDTYGDIIKTVINKARDINKTDCALAMQESLNLCYNDIIAENGKVHRNSQEFIRIKELAKRFALSFGLDPVKNREAFTTLHRKGILFAVSLQNTTEAGPAKAPPNLLYLEVLSEFTNRLLKQDKKLVLTFLDKHLKAGMLFSKEEDWQPLILYRNGLLDGDTDAAPSTSNKAKAKRRKGHVAEEAELDEEDDSPDHHFMEH